MFLGQTLHALGEGLQPKVSQQHIKKYTYSFDALLVERYLDVEVLEIVVCWWALISSSSLSLSSTLMHRLAPASIHLVVLLGILLIFPSSTCARCALHLHRCHLLLHALHLFG